MKQDESLDFVESWEEQGVLTLAESRYEEVVSPRGFSKPRSSPLVSPSTCWWRQREPPGKGSVSGNAFSGRPKECQKRVQHQQSQAAGAPSIRFHVRR